MMDVTISVTTPVEAVDNEVWRDVMGVVGPVGVVEAEEASRVEEEGLRVEEGTPLASPEVASPMMLFKIGAWSAGFPPAVAYALPDLRLKNGRAWGHSLQHFTFVSSPLQHHWLL